LKIQMLGTGSAFAKKYFNTNALIYSNGYTLLIDCGVTATLSLHHLGISLTTIDGIWITHIHADHVGGLEEIAFRSKYELQKRMDLYIPEQLLQTLWENCLKGGLLNMEGGSISLEDYFDVIVVRESHPVKLSNDLIIEPIRTEHVPGKPSYSLYINDFFFYSSDLQFNPDLLLHLHQDRGCETIFHDCQLKPPGIIHTTLTELLTLPLYVQNKIWLMHYGDDACDFVGRTGPMKFLSQHISMELHRTNGSRYRNEID
jgi:ribonuclease BN (tRNA processing enzyme)